jgi:hypothetical protein
VGQAEKAAYNRIKTIRRRVIETPATSIAGIAAKLRAAKDADDNGAHNESCDLAMSAFADAERLAGGAANTAQE